MNNKFTCTPIRQPTIVGSSDTSTTNGPAIHLEVRCTCGNAWVYKLVSGLISEEISCTRCGHSEGVCNPNEINQ